MCVCVLLARIYNVSGTWVNFLPRICVTSFKAVGVGLSVNYI
jgi:hypothetical protein